MIIVLPPFWRGCLGKSFGAWQLVWYFVRSILTSIKSALAASLVLPGAALAVMDWHWLLHLGLPMVPGEAPRGPHSVCPALSSGFDSLRGCTKQDQALLWHITFKSHGRTFSKLSCWRNVIGELVCEGCCLLLFYHFKEPILVSFQRRSPLCNPTWAHHQLPPAPPARDPQGALCRVANNRRGLPAPPRC